MTKINPKSLPGAERQHLNLGYMRLSDSAPLIVAQELGIYSKYGLDVSLHREVSWANIRDKLIAGNFDAVQMLAPMPLVITLGATGIRAPIVTGLVLSLNGNGITLAPPLWERMAELSGQPLQTNDPLATARAFAAALRENGKNQVMTLATVHLFSTHTLLLRMWLKAGGLDPDRDVRIIVLPPEQMVDSLAQGVIDGFCVGEPWNSIAVDYGVGVLASTGFDVWNNAPEKVLGVLEDWHTRNPATHLRLRLALMEACQWLANMDNREPIIEMMSRKEYLDLPANYLRPSMTGQITHDRGAQPRLQANFHVFSRYNAGFPWRSQAELILHQCEPLLGKVFDANRIASITQQCFRTDLYRETARLLDLPTPDKDYKTEGSHPQPFYFSEEIELGSDLMLCP
ncbi:CmpA/NrtA family ABC transporter substrate-binding protein [Porticoccus sp.]